MKPEIRSRLADAVELSMAFGDGTLIVSREKVARPPSAGAIAEKPRPGGKTSEESGRGRPGDMGESGRGRPGYMGESGRGRPGYSAALRKNGRGSTRSPIPDPRSLPQWIDQTFSERHTCPECGVSLPELSPRAFSFNSPYGACERCDGLGTELKFDPELIVADPRATLAGGAIDPWADERKRLMPPYADQVAALFEAAGVDGALAYADLPEDLRRILLQGTRTADEKRLGVKFEGVIPDLERRLRTGGPVSDRSSSKSGGPVSDRSSSGDEGETGQRPVPRTRAIIDAYRSPQPCQQCGGARLRPEPLAVRIGDRNIHDLSTMSIEQAGAFFDGLSFEGDAAAIAAPILHEVRQRLHFMQHVGVGYLTLNRASATLSGGEAQRIRLATQIGAGLVGICYVLDEPTIGLHQRDTRRLIAAIRNLVDIGNTVLVVEHDEDMIRAADHLIELGPGAGQRGGDIIAQGPAAEALAHENSITGKFLSGEYGIPLPEQRRKWVRSNFVEIRAARENNLKNIDVKFPLGVFCAVTGVSGSGKSTLISQILLPALRRRLRFAMGAAAQNGPSLMTAVGAHDQIVGAHRIDRVVEVDQTPIGRTPRSNPATYTGAFDEIRRLYARTKEAKLRGYKSGRFSFNVKGGRCEACQGQGVRRIEMHFLPDVFVECGECKGTRYSRETLDVRYRGKSIADVLDMRVEEAVGFFDNFPKIRHWVQALSDVGLGYIRLGQASNTLSGGEAQRVKLAAELGKPGSGHTLYVLDEPTTGLHFADIHTMLAVLNRLVDKGNTVLVIEHNLDVIKTADWVIDLGPEGGDAGGRIIAEGTPEEIAACGASHTGGYLKVKLGAQRS
jgi:excinuclease ABC subunit A